MSKTAATFGLSALVLAGSLGATALAQTGSQAIDPASSNTSQSSMSPDDKATYATGKPLEQQSKEGFWGHVNPFARKKWVNRQISPIKDRTNELDQLQSKNSKDIKDVDSRATAGINKAMSAAQLADQHAADASNRANSANTLAGNASTRTDALNTTVGNLDQYQTVSSTEVPFVKGRTTLGPKAKADLDDLATKLNGEKGYIVEVQGYSRAGVQASQQMADAVTRYLVTDHQVPVYRIYKSGLGKVKPAEGETAIVNGVRVTLLHNSLASMNSTASTGAPGTSGTSAPPSNQ